MRLCTIVMLLFVSSTDTAEVRSGFAEEYLNKNYTSMVPEISSMATKQVDSKLSCLFECLNENDCSMTVFNQSNFQCMLYNIFPVVDQELLPDNNIIVLVFQRTIQLSASVSNTDWLISRLNATTPSKIIPVHSPRCLIIDIFGYILTLEAQNNSIYINRYDRNNLILIKSTPVSMNYTNIGMLMYYNGMIFVSPYDNTIFIFDHIHFGLLGTIYCGLNMNYPRDIIFIEDQQLLIIALQNANKLFFVRFNSPTNYTCLNNSIPFDDPQALLKINDTFFYVTTWSTCRVYSYQFDGQGWNQSLFADLNQTLGIAGINGGHLQIDNLERRWVMVVGFGLVIYDQWGTLLSMWRFGTNPFDIFIFNDYRLIISDYGTSSLTLYDPHIIA